MNKNNKLKENIALGAIYISAGLVILVTLFIIVYVLVNGMKNVNWQFLTTVTSKSNGTKGIAGNIINTLYLVVITMAMVTLVGLGSAIYLNEYATNKKLVQVIEFTIEVLSGIPSIIFGLFGYMFFGGTLKLGYSIMSGALTLSCMVLPIVIRNCQEALRAVPYSYKQGAIGLGAQKWYVITTILIPNAMNGIITGLILSIGRIVGESAALLYTAGSSKLLPRSITQWVSKTFQSGGSLTVQLYLSATAEGDFPTAYGIAVVLIILVATINQLTRLVTKKKEV